MIAQAHAEEVLEWIFQNAAIFSIVSLSNKCKRKHWPVQGFTFCPIIVKGEKSGGTTREKGEEG